MAYTRNRAVGGYKNKGEVGATPVDKAEFENFDSALDRLGNGGAVPFNVKDYGAKGDYAGASGTDDTAAIQAAITAAASAGGGIVFFPPGRYYVTELTVSGNAVTLLGSGIGDTASGGSGAMLVGSTALATDLVTVSGSRCSIRQMNLSANGHGRDVLRLANTAQRFIGDSLYIQSGGSGTGITHGTSVTSLTTKWSNIYVAGNASHGILVNSSDTEWSNVTTFQNGGDGMRFVGTAGNVANLHTWGNTGAGLNLSGAGCRIANLYSETNTGNGVDVLSASGIYSTITGAVIRANAIGVNVNTSARRTSVVNAKVYNNTAEGIYVQSGDNCQIIGANCFDDQGTKTQTYGIRIAAGVTGTVLSGIVSNLTDHVTAGLLDGGTATERNGAVVVRKAADQSVTSSTTIVNDNDILLAMAAGEVWEIDGVLFVEGAQTGDFSVRLSSPSVGSGFWQALGPAASAASTSAVSVLPLGQAYNTTQTLGMVGAGLTTPIQIKGLLTVGGTGGTFNLKWAQGTSDVTATIVRAGSYLRFRRLA